MLPDSQTQINLKNKIEAKKVLARSALVRLAKYAADFALDCKKFQFKDELLLKDWSKAKPLFDAFMLRAQKYFDHEGPESRDPESRIVYKEFLCFVDSFYKEPSALAALR